MEKFKRFIDCYIPIETCNFQCNYCYIAQKGLFGNKLKQLPVSAEIIRKALSYERLGGKCIINLCASGETLLLREILDVIHALLLEGHYIMVVTNGSATNKFQEISEWDKELLSHLFFKFSFHFLELKRLNMMDRFFENIDTVNKSGCSFTVEMTPCDELVPYIPEIKKTCMLNLGCLCHITVARNELTKDFEILTKYTIEEYKSIWNVFDSKLFQFKLDIFLKKRKEFCYAGDWSCVLNLFSGDLYKCNFNKKMDNIYEDFEKPIKFQAIGRHCSMSHCYNGHVFLALGTIPEINYVTYLELRDRKNGDNWIKPTYQNIFTRKLKESNQEYNLIKKIGTELDFHLKNR